MFVFTVCWQCMVYVCELNNCFVDTNGVSYSCCHKGPISHVAHDATGLLYAMLERAY